MIGPALSTVLEGVQVDEESVRGGISVGGPALNTVSIKELSIIIIIFNFDGWNLF